MPLRLPRESPVVLIRVAVTQLVRAAILAAVLRPPVLELIAEPRNVYAGAAAPEEWWRGFPEKWEVGGLLPSRHCNR